MKVLLLGLNYDPEQIGIGPYTTGTAQALADAGHQVQVVAGKPYYPAWRHDPAYARPFYHRAGEHGVGVLRCPHYVPRVPGGAKRLLHHASFALAALQPMLKYAVGWRPDVVFTVAPSLIAAPVAWLAARATKAKLWLHVQDFEVEAAFATGLLGDKGLGAKTARGFENRMLRSADIVSTISPQMLRKLVEKGVASERIVEFRNWAEIDAIRPLAGPSAYRARWNVGERKVALYSGNIANKQGIEIVVEAARKLADRNDILFVVCGDGPNRARLETLASGLGNIRFHPLQAREDIGELLGLADIHLLPQLADAADLVLPSKLANMLASGCPVVATAAPGTGVAEEVSGCGVIVPPGDAVAMAAAVQALADDPDKALALGRAGRARAEQRWSGRAVLDGFVKRMEELVSHTRSG